MNVWVTRDEPSDGPLSEMLRREGLQPLVEPVIRRRMIDDGTSWLGQLGPDDWLVVTSVYAVQCLAAAPARVPCVAAIGERTGSAARQRGMRVELVARSPSVESVFAELAANIGPRRLTVCYPRSSRAAVPQLLPPNIQMVSPVIYATDPLEFDRGVLDRVDCMAVTSASAVQAIGRVELNAASIGPATTQALRGLGMSPWIESAVATFQSLARAIADQARSSRHHRA